MSTLLIAALGFIFAFGLVVFVHEGGHFLVARWNNVEVEAFALGMGPKLLSYQPGETEYRLCVVPLGGYVKLVGEDISAESDNPRAFVNQPVQRRIMILVAGVLCNLILGYLLYIPYGMVHGEKIMPAKVGLVGEDMPAANKLQVGDRILSLNGHKVETFRDVTVRNSLLGAKDRKFLIERDGHEKLVTIEPQRVEDKSVYEPGYKVGISPYLSPEIDKLRDGSLLRDKGFKPEDKIIAVGDTPVKSWYQLEQLLFENRGKLTVTIGRGEAELTKTISVPDKLAAWRDWKDSFGLVVAETSPRIISVKSNSPAERAGFQAGERLSNLGDTPVVSGNQFFELTKNTHGSQTVQVKREGELRSRTIQLPRREKAWREWYTQLKWSPPVEQRRYGFFGACAFAYRESTKAVKLLFEGLWGLLTQRLSPRSLAGPVGIVAVTGQIATVGFMPLIRFTAFLSINLGILNLLPIPVLDGGHVFLSLPELIGKPLPPIAFEVANKIGLALLLTLLLTVTFFDLARFELVETLGQYFTTLTQYFT